MSAAKEARWLDESQQRSWRALMMGITLLLDRLDADLRRSFDISLAEYEILVRLSELPQRQLRMAQLADAMAHSRSRVTHTVKRMEKAGLVLRTSSADDGRGVVCAMTDKGYELLESMAGQTRSLLSRGTFVYVGSAVPAAMSAAGFCAHPPMNEAMIHCQRGRLTP